MTAAMLRGGTGELSWHEFNGCRPVATFQARTGIALALHIWQINSTDEVLVPAYNCGTEIDPFIKAGAKIVPYRIGPNLQIDLNNIRLKRTDQTRVVYVIHYFGWPQNLNTLRAYCQETGLKLFEDCALALFSRGPDGFVGLQGDAAVFSLPKTLPVPDGGILLLNQEAQTCPNRRPPVVRTLRKLLPLGKRSLLRATEPSKLYRLTSRPRPKSEEDEAQGDMKETSRPDIPESYYFDSATVDWCMSRVTRGLLRHVDSSDIVTRRRRNYLRLLTMIEGLPGLQPLFAELPEGICPIGLPVLVQNRPRWARMLSAAQIDVYAWWSGYHSEIDWDEFPEACHLKDHVLLLPVHQQLDEWHIDYIGRQVALVARMGSLIQGPAISTQKADHVHAA